MQPFTVSVYCTPGVIVLPATTRSRRMLVLVSRTSGPEVLVPVGAPAASFDELQDHKKLILFAAPVKQDASFALAPSVIVSVERKLSSGGAEMVMLGMASASRRTVISIGSLDWFRKLTTRS